MGVCDEPVHVRERVGAGNPSEKHPMTSVDVIVVVASVISSGSVTPFENGRTEAIGAVDITKSSSQKDVII